MPLALPFPEDTITDVFGSWPEWRRALGLGPHRGFDQAPPGGGKIPGSGKGIVTRNSWNGVLGNQLVVKYADAPYIGYNHLAARSPLEVGDPVELGTYLGDVGNTGAKSTGRHCHITASWINGDPGVVPVFDPAPFFGASIAVVLATAIIHALSHTTKETDMPSKASDYRAFEQNQTAGMDEYLSIGIIGPGVRNGFSFITPPDRERYNTLRGILNEYSKRHGDGVEILPENAMSIDATGWSALRQTFDATLV